MNRGRACLLAALLLTAGCRSYTGETDLIVRYRPEVPAGLPDPAAVGCSHHYAPVQYEVSTSWGDSSRLMPTPGGTLLAQFRVERDADYWLSIVDINYCGAGEVDTPSPSSGVMVNGVALTRMAVQDNRKVFLFTVSRGGQVLP